MSVKQNLYQIFKIGSQFIVENNCDIKNYTKSQANREGTLVSIGDNQVFYQIRKHYGDTRNHLEIFKDIQNLRRTLKICKKEGKTQEAKIINRRITDILFVKDIVNVKVENKTSYKQIMKNGFYLNGIHFIRFLAGAGQIRRNTITFINEELYQELTDNLMCDLLNRTKEFNLAKLSAYFALSFSSVLWVRTPRVCVVKDFFNTLPKQKVDFIKGLLPLLNDGGEILIGDVAFNTRAEWEQCRADSGAAWDDDEIYFVFDEIKRHFPKMAFERMSYCSGVLMLCK